MCDCIKNKGKIPIDNTSMTPSAWPINLNDVKNVMVAIVMTMVWGTYQAAACIHNKQCESLNSTWGGLNYLCTAMMITSCLNIPWDYVVSSHNQMVLAEEFTHANNIHTEEININTVFHDAQRAPEIENDLIEELKDDESITALVEKLKINFNVNEPTHDTQNDSSWTAWLLQSALSFFYPRANEQTHNTQNDSSWTAGLLAYAYSFISPTTDENNLNNNSNAGKWQTLYEYCIDPNHIKTKPVIKILTILLRKSLAEKAARTSYGTSTHAV